MTPEKLTEIFAKYGIEFDPAATEMIKAITWLSTAEIANLFNDIIVEDVFFKSPKETRLF